LKSESDENHNSYRTEAISETNRAVGVTAARQANKSPNATNKQF